MKPKVIRLLLLTTALMLLVGCGGISESDIEATVEARVEARIASIPTPNINATVQAAVLALIPTATPTTKPSPIPTATPTSVPTATPTSVPTATPTPTPTTNLTSSEAVGLVEAYLQKPGAVVKTQTIPLRYSSCFSYLSKSGRVNAFTSGYDPVKRIWPVLIVDARGVSFSYTVYDRTMIVISHQTAYC
jgi:hypothetical protein